MTPCPACRGKGGWDRDTYAPLFEPLDPRERDRWHRCPLCRGKGRVALDIEKVTA